MCQKQLLGWPGSPPVGFWPPQQRQQRYEVLFFDGFALTAHLLDNDFVVPGGRFPPIFADKQQFVKKQETCGIKHRGSNGIQAKMCPSRGLLIGLLAAIISAELCPVVDLQGQARWLNTKNVSFVSKKITSTKHTMHTPKLARNPSVFLDLVPDSVSDRRQWLSNVLRSQQWPGRGWTSNFRLENKLKYCKLRVHFSCYKKT